MKKPAISNTPLPMVIAEIGLGALEVILRRTCMMATGSCSIDEYERMMSEKLQAAQRAGLALMFGDGEHAVLRPYHTGVTANLRRLRRAT